MKLISLRTFLALTITAGIGALPVIAACGSDSPPANLSGASSGSSGSGSSSSGSTRSGGSGSSSGSQGSTDAAVTNALDGGAGPPGADALVMYDGAPSTVAADAALGCTTPNGLPIRFNPMYSGYDGVHMYQVPTFVPGMDPSMLTWGSTDPTMVDIQPYAGRPGMMLTTKKAGDVTIVAFVTGSSTCGTALLHIEPYTVDQWNLGNDRYNNGNGLTFTTVDGSVLDGSALPDGAPFPDGGFDASGFDAADLCARLMTMGFTNPFENPPAACTNCHGKTGNGMLFGMTLFTDVQHTPEQTGGFSEADLTNAFVNGTIPPGGYFDTNIISYCVWHQAHTWTDIDTPDKQTGMNAYLRSLTPMEQVGCFELFLSGTQMCSDGGFGTGTGGD